jgi:hypothetical protein
LAFSVTAVCMSEKVACRDWMRLHLSFNGVRKLN